MNNVMEVYPIGTSIKDSSRFTKSILNICNVIKKILMHIKGK